jgi:hypothetical protein
VSTEHLTAEAPVLFLKALDLGHGADVCGGSWRKPRAAVRRARRRSGMIKQIR